MQGNELFYPGMEYFHTSQIIIKSVKWPVFRSGIDLHAHYIPSFLPT